MQNLEKNQKKIMESYIQRIGCKVHPEDKVVIVILCSFARINQVPCEIPIYTLKSNCNIFPLSFLSI